MKLTPSYSYLKDGKRILNAYKVTLTKSECEKYGYKAGTELKPIFTEKEIVLKKQ